ncbi:MAG: archaellin/type IV pilin N-terminal domain-containing protein [Candidatus Bathyarchaeia archaeon]
MARRYAGKRAVSPVIAALIMIVITIAAFSLLYGAMDNWLRAQRAGPLMGLQERLVIEDVWFRTSGGVRTLTSVYVRNIGKVSVEIVSVKIDDVYYPMTPKPLTLTSGVGAQMNVTFSKIWSPGTTYEIILLTDRGGEFTTHATA